MNHRQHPEPDDFVCPHCGADVPEDADFCRVCGASVDSGWDDGDWGEYEEDEDDFDYDDYLRREFPEHAQPEMRPNPRRVLTVVIVLLLCLALILMSTLVMPF
jgi:uncharacterized membrane protein YvbJ